jgi:hypothetical protein
MQLVTRSLVTTFRALAAPGAPVVCVVCLRLTLSHAAATLTFVPRDRLGVS